MHWPTKSLGCGRLAWRGVGCGGCWRMGRGRAKAGVSGGLGCARPGHVRPTGGQSSERVGAPEAHQQAMNPSRARPRFLRIERARAREPRADRASAPAWLRPKPYACWGWVKAAQRGRLRLRRRPAATTRSAAYPRLRSLLFLIDYTQASLLCHAVMVVRSSLCKLEVPDACAAFRLFWGFPLVPPVASREALLKFH